MSKNVEHDLNFALHMSRFVGPGEFGLFLYGPNACLILARVSVALLFEISIKFDTHFPFLYRIHCEISSGLIHDSK
jgi:hypothetical protein